MTAPLSDLRCAYLTGEQIRARGLNGDVAVALARTALGQVIPGRLAGGEAVIEGLTPGTHAVELYSAGGELVAEELINVRNAAGEDPIIAFATSLDTETVESTLRWFERLRCTVVQVYDWMASYSAPLPPAGLYTDPIGRQLDRGALESLIAGIKRLGGVPQAYAPVCAADPGSFPDWRLYRNDGVPETLGDLLDVVDPGLPDWQRHWLTQYGGAADALGFTGFHLDTYGYPRVPLSAHGEPVSIEAAYESFVRAVRAGRPNDLLSFNQVNGVPSGFEPPAAPGFRYVEVWPPNDRWRHLEALMPRSAGHAPRQGDTLAIYPSAWTDGRGAGLRTAVITEAVSTVLGIGTLIWGDAAAALRHPYYVDHERLLPAEAETALSWHRFGLRCRDLFRRGRDTSWYELDDENAAVQVTSSVAAKPEPLGGSLFVRVVHAPGSVVVSLMDLSGSANGSWSEGTGPGSCKAARVSVLIDEPQRWRADAAVLGRDGGRFAPIVTETASHREGRALSCEVPLVEGWSVLRLTNEES
jgi:dextranase